MRTKASSIVATAATLVALVAADVGADVASDRAAAILVFPRVLAQSFRIETDQGSESFAVDTLVQISNTSAEPVRLHCFHIDATSRCSVSGAACGVFPNPFVDTGDLCPLPFEFCLPNWVETDFDITLTPRQPIAWRVSEGLSRDQVPLDGVGFVGIGGASNAGTAIPPVNLHPVTAPAPLPPDVDVEIASWEGELKCVAVDARGIGVDRNVLKGEASIVASLGATIVDPPLLINDATVERYNAVGIQAIGGDVNADGILELGGDAGEYNGCSNVLVANHFFDGVAFGQSELTLVPCSQDLRSQTPGSTTAQFLVFNEFEQRFSTSVRVDCFYRRLLSLIDTNNPERSIFRADVAGTFAGQTRIRGVSSGLIGVLSEDADEFGAEAALNLHLQGERLAADRIILP